MTEKDPFYGTSSPMYDRRGGAAPPLNSVAAPAPRRPLDGASANSRGLSRQVTLPTMLGGGVQVIDLLQTPRDGGEEAEVLTVQLGLTIPDKMIVSGSGGYASAVVNVVGIIKWGNGGAFYSAEVDWNQGSTFSLCASYVSVSARVAAFPALSVPDVDMTLTASIAYGNASSINQSSPVRRTVRAHGAGASRTLEAGETTQLLPIPPWSLGLTVVDGGFPAVGFVPSNPDYLIALFDKATNTFDPSALYRMTSRENLANQLEGQFPVPGGCRFFRLKNDAGVKMQAPKLIFNLGF